MKQVPTVYSPSQIKEWDCEYETPTGKWLPARPIGLLGLFYVERIKVAWGVFTGKYDALDWKKGCK